MFKLEDENRQQKQEMAVMKSMKTTIDENRLQSRDPHYSNSSKELKIPEKRQHRRLFKT